VHEFTRDIARELGEDAENMREALRSNAAEKVVVPIDGIAALGAFTAAGDAVQIERMIGVKATALKSKDEGEGPTIQLEFDFPWSEAAWLFLGRHCSAVADVVLTKTQLVMAMDGATN
jgi:hypothetical protein